MEKVKDKGDEALYDKLDSAYPSDDENYEVALSAIITPTVSKKKLMKLVFIIYFCVNTFM